MDPLFAVYFAPTILAIMRLRKPMILGEIFMLNFIFGWTIIGWAYAFCAAMDDKLDSPPKWTKLLPKDAWLFHRRG